MKRFLNRIIKFSVVVIVLFVGWRYITIAKSYPTNQFTVQNLDLISPVNINDAILQHSFNDVETFFVLQDVVDIATHFNNSDIKSGLNLYCDDLYLALDRKNDDNHLSCVKYLNNKLRAYDENRAFNLSSYIDINYNEFTKDTREYIVGKVGKWQYTGKDKVWDITDSINGFYNTKFIGDFILYVDNLLFKYTSLDRKIVVKEYKNSKSIYIIYSTEDQRVVDSNVGFYTYYKINDAISQQFKKSYDSLINNDSKSDLIKNVVDLNSKVNEKVYGSNNYDVDNRMRISSNYEAMKQQFNTFDNLSNFLSGNLTNLVRQVKASVYNSELSDYKRRGGLQCYGGKLSEQYNLKPNCIYSIDKASVTGVLQYENNPALIILPSNNKKYILSVPAGIDYSWFNVIQNDFVVYKGKNKIDRIDVNDSIKIEFSMPVLELAEGEERLISRFEYWSIEDGFYERSDGISFEQDNLPKQDNSFK